LRRHPGMEKRKNKMYLANANSLNITFMPMASDVYGSMSVTFLSVLTKAAEMISEISASEPCRQTLDRREFHLPHTNLIAKPSPIKESSSTDLLIELTIIVLSVSV
jgi:hypothetical protein